MNIMRAMVVGNPASGKSTFAAALGNRLNVPVVYSDAEFERAGRDKKQSDGRIIRAASKSGWIIEGVSFVDPDFEGVISRADHMFALRPNRFRTVAGHIARNRRAQQGREVIVGRDEAASPRARLGALAVGGRIVHELVEVPSLVSATLTIAKRLGIEVTVFRGHNEASEYLATIPLPLDNTAGHELLSHLPESA